MGEASASAPPACAAIAAKPTARMAGRIVSPASASGATFARPPRPIPKQLFSVLVNSAVAALRRPRRGPSYPW